MKMLKLLKKYNKDNISITRSNVKCQMSNVKRSGYTLLELLVSLAILGLMASVGFVYLSSYRHTTSLNSEANKLVSYLRQTQNKAIAGQDLSNWGIRLVNPVGDANDYYFVFKGDYSTTDTVYLNKVIGFSVPEDNSSTTIIFQRISGATTSTSVTLVSKTKASLTKTLNINSLGQVNQ